MGRPLIERMASVVDLFFKADRVLMSSPSFETLRVAKEVSAAYHESEQREYKAMVEDGTWDQGACDIAMRMSDECDQAQQVWLQSVEEELLDPSKSIVETIVPSPILRPILLVPVLPKAQDRAFF